MRRTISVMAVVACLAAGPATAQYTYVNEGISNITGTGARALGMGGAFVALADDATAASWNPAGLIQLTRPEVSFVYDWSKGPFDISRDLQAVRSNGRTQHTVTSGNYDFEDSNVGFVSVTYPFVMKSHRFVAQASYRRMASYPDLTAPGRTHSEVVYADGTPVSGDSFSQQIDNWTGGFDVYSLSLASEVGAHVRLGVSLNYVDTALHERYRYQITDPNYSSSPFESGREALDESFSGWQGDIGVQWSPIDSLTFGAVYHTGFTAGFKDSDHWQYPIWDEAYEGGPGPVPSSASGRSTVRWPDGYAVGVAWRAAERLVLALDYGQTFWPKGKLGSFTYASWDENGNPAPYVQYGVHYPSFTVQHDSSTARFGAEYSVYLGQRTFLPIRAGYFRDRQLAALPGFWETGLLPQAPPTFDGYSLGLGVTRGRFNFDVAWVTSRGEQSGTTTYQTASAPGVSPPWTQENTLKRTVKTHTDRFLASVILRF